MNKKSDPDRIVKTVFGKSTKRSECRYIKGDFYKMNEECFKFEGRWYRINSGFLVQDITTGKYILKESEDIIYGLAVNTEGKLVIGHFVRNLFMNLPISSTSIPHDILRETPIEGNTVYANNMEVVKKLGLVEDIPTGIFMKRGDASKKIAINGSYNFNIDYSFETSGQTIKDAFREYSKNKIGKSLNSRLLDNITYGWEFETTDGFIHPRHLMKTSLIPLRDGSISGYEYVTCPLQGAHGLDTTIAAAKVMKKYTTNNISCALHLHIGNIPKNEAFLVDFYKVCYSIQRDIFNIFPQAMERTSKYKDRDYCNKIPKLALNFGNVTSAKIIDWVAHRDGYYANNYRGLGRVSHPDDEGNNRKWAISSRYVWMNLVPYIFSDRHTVEFRIHTPSSNPAKLINWLYICAGIVNFTKKFAPNYLDISLEKLTLKQIIKTVYGDSKDISDYLCKYIDWRKAFMNQCATSGDDIGNTEIMSDLDFTFPFNGKETLVSNG